MQLKLYPFILLLLIYGCNNNAPLNVEEENSVDPTSKLMEQVYLAHGELGNYSFKFRGNDYSFSFDGDEFQYKKSTLKDSVFTEDLLTNDLFERRVDWVLQDLSQEDSDKYSESLNSVVYFTCLPLNLNAPAVNRALKPQVSINNTLYDVIEVTFDEEGGGKDHDDVFYYWFNNETHIMDFMAYSYKVNGGGVRFREAYNSRMIDGMRFQDYVNYSAPADTPLDSLPILFEQKKLEELSLIVAEQVAPFNKTK